MNQNLNSNDPTWLPEIICYFGEWNEYLTIIYEYFFNDFILKRPLYKGMIVKPCDITKIDGKEKTFWHLIQSGEKEEDRIPDFRRCERIRWPKPIIENHYDNYILIWEENKKKNRKKDKRLYLWLENKDYLIVMSVRKNYFLLVTSFITDRNHTRKKLKKNYEDYKKQMPPS